MNKRFIAILMILSNLCFGMYCQISRTDVAQHNVKEQKELMDSTKVRLYYGHEALVGEYCFFMDRRRDKKGTIWAYGYNCGECTLSPQELEQLYGKRFIVDRIIGYSDNLRLQCETVDSIGNRTGFKFIYRYMYTDRYYKIPWAFTDQILPERTYNYLVKKYVGKRFYIRTRELPIEPYDMKTGDKIENYDKQKWTCIGLSCIDDGTFVFLVKSESQYYSYAPIKHLDLGFTGLGAQKIFSNEEWNALGKKYGYADLRRALRYEFWEGMPESLLILGMGKYDDCIQTSEYTQYIYGNTSIFVEDGKVTSWF